VLDHFPAGVTLPDDRELIAYARGWLHGYERAYTDGHVDGMEAAHEHWTECVRRANKRSERAGAAKEWRAAVLRGENPMAGKHADDASHQAEQERMKAEAYREAQRVRAEIAKAEAAERAAREALRRGDK
jgi:hypothetical protein